MIIDQSTEALAFRDFVLDPTNEQLIGPGGPVHIGRKAYRVLRELIAKSGRVVTKEALFDRVWDGAIVSESALTSVVKELRRALGDTARNSSFIESVYGRGYRFLPTVSQTRRPDPPPIVAIPLDSPSVSEPVISYPDGERGSLRNFQRFAKPWQIAAGAISTAAGLVVLVTFLTNLGPSPSVETEATIRVASFRMQSPDLSTGFADSIRDEITTAFSEDYQSKVSLLVADEAAVGEHPTFFVTGGARREGEDIIAIVRLQDDRSQKVIWSKSFSHPVTEAGTLPRRLAVSTALLVRCSLGVEGATSLPHEALKSWASMCSNGGLIDYDYERAILDAQRVASLAPDFPEAWTVLSGYARYQAQTEPEKADQHMAEARRLNAKALALDPDNGTALISASALLDPNDLVGRERLLRQAVAAKPLDCMCEQLSLGNFLFNVGRIEEAQEYYAKATSAGPIFPGAFISSAYYYALKGNRMAARENLQTVERLRTGHQDRTRGERITIATLAGDYAKAVQLLSGSEQVIDEPQREAWSSAYSALSSGTRAERDEAAMKVESASQGLTSDALVSVILLERLGRPDAALSLIERIAVRSAERARAGLALVSNATRGHPAFLALAHQTGLVSYWEKTQAPSFCQQEAPPALCRGL